MTTNPEPDAPALVPVEQCDRAPKGWYCTRGADHQGPCAAREVEESTLDFVQRWMMSSDHEPDQWHRNFAAAIDRRRTREPAAQSDIDHTINRLKREITKPLRTEDRQRGSEDVFDPWNVFDCFYGSYSSEFDDMAILVLENILNGKFGSRYGEGLAHEMFREVLCTSDLCDYGTGPRGCFPNWTNGFKELLPELIAKWREYRRIQWE